MQKLVREFDANGMALDTFEGTDVTWATLNGYAPCSVEPGWDGCWYRAGEAPAMPAEEQERRIREKRDSLLVSGCDSIPPLRLASMTEEQKRAWAEYRQALLDITSQEGFPWDGDVKKAPWPERPEA